MSVSGVNMINKGARSQDRFWRSCRGDWVKVPLPCIFLLYIILQPDTLFRFHRNNILFKTLYANDLIYKRYAINGNTAYCSRVAPIILSFKLFFPKQLYCHIIFWEKRSPHTVLYGTIYLLWKFRLSIENNREETSYQF